MTDISESLREVMRGWPTGVAIVTGEFDGERRGLTVNSLASVSLDPPRVVISLGEHSRTKDLVLKKEAFGVTLLDASQQSLADIFSGRTGDDGDRFKGVETFTLNSGVPLLKEGRAFLDCRVVHVYSMPNSTLFIGEVLAAQGDPGKMPLVYLNRSYHQVVK